MMALEDAKGFSEEMNLVETFGLLGFETVDSTVSRCGGRG